MALRLAGRHARSGQAIAPGAFHLDRYLTIDEQRTIVEQCRALVDGDVPAYVPIVRGGGSMHVRMLCLGRHWNGKLYLSSLTERHVGRSVG